MTKLTSLICGILLTAVTYVSAEPIHEAIVAEDLLTLKAMLAENPDLANLRTESKSTPLHLAVEMGNLEAVKILLDAGADVNGGDNERSTALFTSGTRANVEISQLLIDRGTDVGLIDDNGNTALHFAAIGGNVDIIRMILSKTSDIDVLNNRGTTPLMYAAGRGFIDAVKLLVEKGADVSLHGTENAPPLALAAYNGSLETCKYLVEKGADVNQPFANRNTAIFNAAMMNRPAVIDYLISQGASASAKDSVQNTPLHFAAWRGSIEATQALIAAGADPNALDRDGCTALHYGAQNGLVGCCEALLTAGADPDIKESRRNRTALHLAALKGYDEIVSLLADKKATIDLTDGDGHSPLYYASYYAHKPVADILLTRGAASEGIDLTFGRSPLLDKPLPSNDAVVWYLGHSGWAIKTQNNLLIFDYFNRGGAPASASLNNGHINPEEIKDLKVTVFVSHEHGDHYDTSIFAWRNTIPNISFVLGFQPNGVTGYEYAGPRTDRTVNGIEISTITSTDSGVGFLVKVDGITIFHAGDHANRERDLSGPFPVEIDYLAQQNLKIDLAFMGISGCSFGDLVAVKQGVIYTINKLSPKVLFPQHAINDESRYRTFADEVGECASNILCAGDQGDRFVYQNGDVIN